MLSSLQANSTSISSMSRPHTECCLAASPRSTPHVAPVAVFVLNRTCQNISISCTRSGWSETAGWKHTTNPGSSMFPYSGLLRLREMNTYYEVIGF